MRGFCFSFLVRRIAREVPCADLFGRLRIIVVIVINMEVVECGWRLSLSLGYNSLISFSIEFSDLSVCFYINRFFIYCVCNYTLLSRISKKRF